MQGQTFKDFPAQSHIELRFSNRDQNILEKEEALMNYRKNNHLLGKIFSYDMTTKKICKERFQNPEPSSGDVEVNLQKMRDDLGELTRKYAARHQEFKSQNAAYQQVLKEASSIKSRSELQELIGRLGEQKIVTNDHPFLNPASSFYMSSFEEQVKEVRDPDALFLLKEQLASEPVIQLGN